ncbi:hypothetical protein BH09MYX1_BH09MYX1_49290 [soil metagenome]
MRRFAAFVPLLAVLGLVACPPLELSHSAKGISNGCTSTSACVARFGAGVVCDGGACVSAAAYAPVFVVSVPSTERGSSDPRVPSAAGFTFAFTPTRTAGPRPEGCNSDKTADCIQIPAIASVKGSVDVSLGLMKTLSPPRGLTPTVAPADAPPFVSLPAQLRFHPLWVDPATGDINKPLDASVLGLPLPYVVSGFLEVPTPPRPTNGLDLGFGIGFTANVPISDSPDGRAAYEVEVDPVSPYEIYPPVLQSIRIGGSGTPITYRLDTLASAGAIVVNAKPLKIVAAGAPPRDYRAYLARADGVRVSGVKVLDAVTSQDIVLYTTLSDNDLKGCDLVLEPPAGSEGLITQRIQGTGGIYAPGTFPSMPPPVAISGRVTLQGDLGSPVGAEIDFRTESLVDVDGKSPVAVYHRRVRTRLDEGHTGEYTVNLPPGRYDIQTMPLSGSLSALSTKSNFDVSVPQVGAGISVGLKWHLRGRVVLADATPAPSTEIVATATPEKYAVNNPPPILPREARATTDAAGKFDLLVDDGTYDLTIKPNAQTRLPFVISTQHQVTSDVDLVDALVVPVPSVKRGVLLDYLGNTMVRVLIRAYAFPEKGSSPSPTPRPARLVGETYTDSLGRYELFLARPPT